LSKNVLKPLRQFACARSFLFFAFHLQSPPMVEPQSTKRCASRRRSGKTFHIPVSSASHATFADVRAGSREEPQNPPRLSRIREVSHSLELRIKPLGCWFRRILRASEHSS
jgi:hypothetical protein